MEVESFINKITNPTKKAEALAAWNDSYASFVKSISAEGEINFQWSKSSDSNVSYTLVVDESDSTQPEVNLRITTRTDRDKVAAQTTTQGVSINPNLIDSRFDATKTVVQVMLGDDFGLDGIWAGVQPEAIEILDLLGVPTPATGYKLTAKDGQTRYLYIDPATGFPGNIQAYRYAANSLNQVTTQGFSVGFNHYFRKYCAIF